MNSPGNREKGDRSDRSYRERRSASPAVDKPKMGLPDRSASNAASRRERDRERTQRERQRSCSPSARRNTVVSDTGSVSEKRSGSGDRLDRSAQRSNKHRPRRKRQSATSNTDDTMAWSRGAKSPGSSLTKSPGGPKRRHTQDRDAMAFRQLKQVGPPLVDDPDDDEPEEGTYRSTRNGHRDSVEDEFDVLAAAHRDANQDQRRSSLFSVGEDSAAPNNNKKKSKKRSSKTAAIASSHDIDQVIAQFREQCDVHMATLLELKNNITTTEKEVNVSSEKDKEFQQVRQWYSALAEKHTKLQKEHQALQEEHVKLQERYMNLKRATSHHDSFVAQFDEEDKKKDKKEKKSAVDIVWSRAVKPAGRAAVDVAGNVASKVSKKKNKHQLAMFDEN